MSGSLYATPGWSPFSAPGFGGGLQDIIDPRTGRPIVGPNVGPTGIPRQQIAGYGQPQPATVPLPLPSSSPDPQLASQPAPQLAGQTTPTPATVPLANHAELEELLGLNKPQTTPGVSPYAGPLNMETGAPAAPAEAEATRSRYQLPDTAGPAFRGPTGTTDPSGFSALDFLLPADRNRLGGDPTGPTPRGPQPQATDPARFDQMDYQGANQGRLTQQQLDAQYARMIPGESGGKVSAHNPTSGADGAVQFIPSTLNKFLASAEGRGHTAEEFRKSPELQRKAADWLNQQNASTLQGMLGQTTPETLTAAYAIGPAATAAMVQHPDENAAQLYARATGQDGNNIIKGQAWGITPEDTGAQAIAKVNAYYARTATKTGPTQTTGGSTPPSDQTATPVSSGQTGTPTRADASTPTSNRTPLPDALAGYRPVEPSDQLLAAAGGIFRGGPGTNGLVNGLGLGIQAAQKLGFDDQTQRFKIMQEAANTQLLKQRLGLVDAQTTATLAKPGQANTKLGIDQQNADTKRVLGVGNLALGERRANTADGRLDLGNHRLQAQLDGELAQGAATGKSNQGIEQNIVQDSQAAAEDRQQLANLKATIQANPQGVGDNVINQAARFFANRLNIDVGADPSTTAIQQKIVQAFNNQNAFSVWRNGGAHGTAGRLTQGEFGLLKQASAGLQTNPKAFLEMLNVYDDAANRRMALGDRYTQLRQDPTKYDQAMHAPGGMNGWLQDVQREQNAARQIQTGQPVPSEYVPSSQGSNNVVYRGGGANGVPAYTATPIQ